MRSVIGTTLAKCTCGPHLIRLQFGQKYFFADESQDCRQADSLAADSKLIPTFIIGKRAADMARRLILDLASRLNMPRPQDWNSPGFDKVVQISTDGFWGYPEAIDLAFGPYVKFGTIEKDYRNANMRPGTYSPAEMVRAKRKARFGMSEDEMDARQQWRPVSQLGYGHSICFSTK
jgi:hypothetical protein